MKFAFLFFLLLPIAGQTYVAWRTWQLLPDIMPLRMAVVGLMAHDRMSASITGYFVINTKIEPEKFGEYITIG